MATFANPPLWRRWPVLADWRAAWRAPWAMLGRCAHAGCACRRIITPRAGGWEWAGQRLCSAECFEAVAESELRSLLPALAPSRPRRHRLPLGLLMIEQGSIEAADLRRALAAQREAGAGRIGDWLQRLGLANEAQVTAALARQWGCPVFPLGEAGPAGAAGRMLPRALLQGFGMAPAHFAAAQRTLYLACRQSVDRSAIYAMEEMLGHRIEPCMADASAVDRRLAELSRERGEDEASFDSPFRPAELSACARSYGAKLGARRAHASACGEYLWIRCQGAASHFDLVFRRPAAALPWEA